MAALTTGDVLPPASIALAVAEAKAFLRLGDDSEDGLVAGFLRTATVLAEAFTGLHLIARAATETVAAELSWQRLGAVPVVEIAGVGAGVDGAGPLPGGAFETDIDLSGNGWVRVIDAGAASRVVVRYRVGLAADWTGVPEPLRQGIVRLVSHLHAHRDAPDAGGTPTSVVALWRPWRRMRLN